MDSFIIQDFKEHNSNACFSGRINKEITPEFLVRFSLSVSNFFGDGSKILLSLSDQSRYMMLKFALLSGMISGGAEAYHLVKCGDRYVAKFALRKLSLSGGIHVQITGQRVLLEVYDKNGAPISRKDADKIHELIHSDSLHHVELNRFIPPVNIQNMPIFYFKDLVATTVCKRLNFSVAICTQSSSLKENFKRISSAFGIVTLFTNDQRLMPDLIQKNNLDFGIEIGENGKFALLDNNGKILSADMFYGLVALMVFSADEQADFYIPEHLAEALSPLVENFSGTMHSLNEDLLEASVLQDKTLNARLQHDLCYDPLRATVRLCEFLYLNGCTLSYVCGLLHRKLPVNHDAKSNS